jgi:hypothetical protein
VTPLGCPKCGRLVYAPPEAAGRSISCPGCNEAIPVPAESAAAADATQSCPCPLCGAPLRLVQQLRGKRVRCTRCAAVLRVAADSWDLSVVSHAAGAPVSSGVAGSALAGSSAASLRASAPTPSTGVPPVPNGMPPMPHDPVHGDDPLSFLSDGVPSGMPRYPTDGQAFAAGSGRHDAMSGIAPHGPMKRPVGLVWIVFYWIPSGIAAMVWGLVLQFAGNFAAGVLAGTQGGRQFEQGAAVGAEVLGIIGLLCFHLGLLLLVACYGLWTSRKWGLTMAKVLAAILGVFSLIGFIGALVIRAGIVVSLANTIVAACILVYLFTGTGFSDSARRYIGEIRSRTATPSWEGFD